MSKSVKIFAIVILATGLMSNVAFAKHKKKGHPKPTPTNSAQQSRNSFESKVFLGTGHEAQGLASRF